MNLRKLFIALVAAAVLFVSISISTQAQKAESRPKLVVVLVVDQMRADYVDRFQHEWTKGLRRLLDHGAWFRLAAYPYFNTVTCAGHATISTGSFPATHGIILNGWWDRSSGRPVSCTDDQQARAISYGAAAAGGHSAARLVVPTLADELRVQLGAASRVVTFSMKPRSAIMLAGHRADALAWFEPGEGAWVTSSAYTTSPIPFLEKFLKSHPVENDFGKSWTHSLPDSAYLFEDAGLGERPLPGWTASFPHPLHGQGDKPDRLFYAQWEESPFSDAYLGELAQAAVDALGLGKGPGTDFLGVGFSALDVVGHSFGPRSQEVQDLLARLDATIGALLEHLDRAVGPENYVVALSADHGVAPIPEQMAREGFDAGRIVIQDVVERVEKALEPKLGPGQHVARLEYTDLYFAPGIYPKLAADPALMQVVTDAILAVPGVWRVFRGEELQDRGPTADRTLRAAALSYYPGRSGDLVVVPRPYWFFVPASRNVPPGPATTHGTAHLYDTRVPMILMGPGIKPGEYLEPATPADIAPTLAFLCGITLAQADGHVLGTALVARPPRDPVH